MNKTSVLEFVFAGLTDRNELNVPLFIIFLHVYITTIVGNVGIIIIIVVDRHLHRPMYLFLSNLSFVDLTYSSAVTPTMLRDLLSENKVISFAGCAIQMFIFVSFATIECLFLGIMAYDRYGAICCPLLYGILMSRILCLWMVVAAYFVGFLTALVHTVSVFLLSFCRSNVIDHFFCDLPPLYKLSCSDTSVNLVVLIILGSMVSMSCFILIIFSYTNIVLAILRIRSTQGSYKAFNTCTSHMTAVSVFYGAIFFMYLRPSSSYVLQQDRVASVFYSILIALLNPFIYSLWNAEVKAALKSLLKYFQK
ncbi:PREDICTED: olfactory receptor 1019-like [Nanorana parkeri]|uniref:olfactory receptor 1019-like n=1 Tax=Nanorana parkeri TaxID=125878 RepID=UPI000854C1BA|nr:PREDICTED: olfactory receptor 1019-like [Nanorana parkeri]